MLLDVDSREKAKIRFTSIWTMIFCCCLEMQQPLYRPCIAISEAHKDKGHSTVHPFLFSFRKKYFYLSFIIIILFFQKIKLCVVISVYNLQHSSYSSFFFFFKTYSTYLSSSMSQQYSVYLLVEVFFVCVVYINNIFFFWIIYEYTNF